METINETDLQCTEGHYLDEFTQFDKISVKLHNRITPGFPNAELNSKRAMAHVKYIFLGSSQFYPGDLIHILRPSMKQTVLLTNNKNEWCITHADDIKHSCDHHSYIPKKRTTSTKRS